MPSRGENKSTIRSSRIGVVVKNQDGVEVFCRIKPSSQLKILMHGYCEQESKEFGSIAFLFDGCFLQKEQTADELGIEEGSKIYAFYAESLRQSMDVQESLNGKSPVEEQRRGGNENLVTYTFDELEKKITHSVKQAMSFLKVNRLSEDARKYMEEIQTKTKSLMEVLSAKMATEKVADSDRIIEEMRRELREAKAEILKVKELITANKESAQVHNEVENSKRASVGVSRSERKRARLNEEEGEKATDDSGRIGIKVKNLDGVTVFYMVKRSTQLKKVMEAYCDREMKDFDSMHFVLNGRRIYGDQTPDELQINNGDEIHALPMQMA